VISLLWRAVPAVAVDTPFCDELIVAEAVQLQRVWGGVGWGGEMGWGGVGWGEVCDMLGTNTRGDGKVLFTRDLD
jgi:hypothetical protein